MSKGFVYVLTNKSMPGLVKIGMTQRTPESRAAELFQTGTPTPFDVYESVLSPDCLSLEASVHEHFADKRINVDREFFQVEPEEAIEFMRFMLEQQVSDWVTDFLPDYALVSEYHYIDPADVALLATKCATRPENVTAAFYLIEPEEYAPALQRWEEKLAARKAPEE